MKRAVIQIKHGLSLPFYNLAVPLKMPMRAKIYSTSPSQRTFSFASQSCSKGRQLHDEEASESTTWFFSDVRGMEVPWASKCPFCLVSSKGKGEVAWQCDKGYLCHFLKETLWEVIKRPLLEIVKNRKNTRVRTKPVGNKGSEGAEEQVEFWDTIQL